MFSVYFLITLQEMAYRKRHMFCVLFDVVLLISVVAGAQQLSDTHVSGPFGDLLIGDLFIVILK